MASVHPRYLPVPYQDSAESGRLILRDGTVAEIRLAQPKDCQAMMNFFIGLSGESRRRRFFGFGRPSDKLINAFCDSSDVRKQLSLIVTRPGAAGRQIIATGNYVALDDNTAEVAMAVDDSFRHLFKPSSSPLSALASMFPILRRQQRRDDHEGTP